MEERKVNSTSARNPVLPPISLPKLLEEEMIEGVLNLSDVSRITKLNEIESLKDACRPREHPEDQFRLLLFRKYAGIANDIKDSIQTKNQRTLLGGDLPSLVYEVNDEQLTGWAAVRTNAFWLRFFEAMLCFVAVVLLSNVKYISTSSFTSSHYFLDGCRNNIHGSFNMQPYRLIISVSVILYCHSFIVALYYLLPVDASQRKIIPGLKYCLEGCHSSYAMIEDIADSISTFLKVSGKYVLLLADTTALSLSWTSFLIAAISLDRSAVFTDNGGDVQYYNLATFFQTFQSTNPKCINDDPTSLIRAALAMFFLVTFLQFLSAQGSYKAYKYEIETRQSRSNFVIAGHQQGEEMRALPLPTEDDSGQVDDNAFDEVTV